MKTRLLSVLLIFLLVSSAFVPAVSAEPIPLAAAPIFTPATAEIIINGVTVVITGVAALKYDYAQLHRCHPTGYGC